MTRITKIILALLALLAVAMVVLSRGCGKSRTSETPSLEDLPLEPVAPPSPAPTMSEPTSASPKTQPAVASVPKHTAPVPTPPLRVISPPPPPSAPTPQVPAGQEGMHRELIPREITIVRCYYDETIVGPGMRFGFDINGSGFNEAFYRIIEVDPDALDVTVENLRLVTANQIHGEIVVGSEATTQYIHPKILIRHLPVFRAPDPFGVVRPNEVLDIQLLSIDESGQSGRFDVITNLTEANLKRLRIVPSTDKLNVSSILPNLPFHVVGVMQIGQGLTNGQYGLTAYMGNRVVFKKDPLVDVVKPNVGKSGSIDSLKAAEPAHRPNDIFTVSLRGSGFTQSDSRLLSARTNKMGINSSTVTYVSGGRMEITFQLPENAAEGLYGVSVFQNGKEIYQQDRVFAVVPANWLSGVQLQRPLGPGTSGTLHIKGRDITAAYVQGLEIAVEEKGLQLSPLRLQDASTIAADLQVDASVAPGDYLMHVSHQGKLLKLPRGSLIKITR